MEKYTQLKELLKGFEAEKFISYCRRSELEQKNGKPKNPHFGKLSAEKLAELFKRVNNEGLEFDGVHITIQSTGINYDYVAYKNKMLIAYPESLIDLQLVYKEDTISFAKKSGSVIYSHEIANPFNQVEADIIGGYCVIKNKRGEFLTTLSSNDIDKHKKVARTSFIWNAWFKEMCLKTIIKKAVKYHFDDVYVEMEKDDNLQYDLEKAIDWGVRIKECSSTDELDMIWSGMSAKEQTKFYDKFKEKEKSLK